MKKNTPYWLGAIVLVIIILAGAFIRHSVVYQTEISEFQLTASASDSAGIAAGSHFILKTTSPLTPQVLEKYLKITPETDFKVEKVADQDNTYEIIPTRELDQNKVYTIKIEKGPLADRDFAWAYQTKAPYQAVSSVPRNEALEVPVRSGIEIEFNRQPLDPQSSIEITPAVQGRFIVAGNKVTFVPNAPLAPRSVYTVKVKSGLKAEGSTDVLAVDHIIRFETSQNYEAGKQESWARLSRDFSEFNPGSNLVFGMSAYNTKSVSAAVYRLSSAEEYIKIASGASGDAPWSNYHKGFEKQLEGRGAIFTGALPVEGDSYDSKIRIPQVLGEGYYALTIDANGQKSVAWFQVNKVASFAALSSVRSVVWLKDISTGKNISGAPIFLGGKQLGQTGADGVALIGTPTELLRKTESDYFGTGRKFFLARIPTGDLVIPIENEYGNASQLMKGDAWWSYISFNKNIYLPTDTLRFWAISKPRSDGAQPGDAVSVKLTNSYWSETQPGVVTYAETEAKISEFNAVTGELSFEGLRPGVYDLTFRRGNEIVGKQTVTVAAYVKPAYKLTVTPDRTAIFAGESVAFKVKAEFFDGTPVSNIDLLYRGYGTGFNSDTHLRLNAQGEASFSLTAPYDALQNYWPAERSVSVSPLKAEEGDISAQSSIIVFGPRINTSIGEKRSAAGVTFDVKTRSIVIRDQVRGAPYWYEEQYLGAPVSGATTKVDLAEIEYVREQKGTGYDAINKVSYPIYEYKTVEHPRPSQTILSDQNGSAQIFAPLESKKTYKFTFTTADAFGRNAVDTRYVYGGYADSEYSPSGSTRYYLSGDNRHGGYKIGEQVNLQLQTDHGTIAPSGDDRYVFLTVRNGDIEYEVKTEAKYARAFQEKDVPNIGVWSGWFSDGRFHNSYVENVSFDANERRLNIEISKDKLAYKPGEEVILDIKVTDKDRKPVQAEVNLSALDAAVFSLAPDERDIISDLYRDLYSQVVIRSSNAPAYGGGGAEKGGGGDDSLPRTNIREMSIFRSVVTDASGKARVQFKLPDNITSWRLTSQAVTKGLFAGKDVSFIPVSLPFFVESTLNNTYLAGDQITLRFRTFGPNSNTSGTTFSVESATLPFKKLERVGGSSIEMPLGQLTLGMHKVLTKAVSGNSSDALVRDIRVLDSYFTKNVSDFKDGISGMKIKNAAIGYTTLTFGESGRGRLYDSIKSLSYQYGVRVDQKGSETVAKKLLSTYFGEKDESVSEAFRAEKYQSYDGGIQLLPYSSDDIELSAMAAHLFEGSAFERASLKRYLLSSLANQKSDSGRIARALYGLSAFDEPILTKLQSFKSERLLTPKDRIFVALALDAVGAKEDARAYYRQAIKPSIVAKGSYAHIDASGDDEVITTTALAAALAASLEEPEWAQLARYADENFPRGTLSNFERLLYMKAALQKLDAEEVSFTYRTQSKSESKTLKNGELYQITLSPQDLASFELSDVKGKLGVIDSHEERSSPLSIAKDSDLSIRRTYYVNGIQTKEFRDGDLVLVRLEPSFKVHAPNGAYQVVDHLPSGLRTADREVEMYSSRNSQRIYPTEINDQKVTFVVYKDMKLPPSYYARVVSKGTYKAEPAILQSLSDLESITVSDETQVTIK